MWRIRLNIFQLETQNYSTSLKRGKEKEEERKKQTMHLKYSFSQEQEQWCQNFTKTLPFLWKSKKNINMQKTILTFFPSTYVRGEPDMTDR